MIKTNQLGNQGQTLLTITRERDELGRVVKLSQDLIGTQDTASWRSYRYDNPNYPMQPTVIIRPSVVEGKTAQTKLDYDEAGNVIAMTEVGYRPAVPTDTALDTNHKIERTTRFHYTQVNGRDLLTAIDAPQASDDSTSANTKNRDIGQTKYVWDELGENITQILYPEGLTESFDYQNIAGKTLPTKHTAPDGVTTTLSYNTKGLPIVMQRGDQTVKVAYDSRQRPVKWQNQLNQTISASYDDSQQQVTYQLHDGQKVVNQYNTEGQLINRQWLDDKGNVIIDSDIIQSNIEKKSECIDNSMLLDSIKVMTPLDIQIFR